MQTINARYRLGESIGAGGMGVVYRAYDRLTGQTVALKQVQVAPQALAFASRSATDDTHSLLLSLAQEFKLLASLRHPHIISVLDYGFDANRQPYFTMELLNQPQTLLEAGRGQPLAFQIDLLCQTLQALAYLHRRGIFHRDLKPENVLVSQGRVRVLDFGLAVVRDQARRGDDSGTLLYMPPEVQEGLAPSEAADLYTMGILIYEMLVGRHPFYSADLQEFLDRLWQSKPDLAPLAPLTAPNAPITLPAMLERLLTRQPAARYPTATAVIEALCLALGQPLPLESVAVRESFLQAATFVGRKQEMRQLTAALIETLQGQGSAWLIGGESGVGKSRLLDELRTQALVDGAMVVRGQAVEESGLPYQLWREPMRRLVLTTALSDLEAGILKTIVPDIGLLLEREVADAPALAGGAERQRLFFTVSELLKRQSAPVVLLLEDLQWGGESLLLLQQVIYLVTECRLLIVANYRDDEDAHLADKLPGMKPLKLARLNQTEVRTLSTAMLGVTGQQGELINFLQQETEGNTFFMVEAIRALAEAAGGLLDIGRMTLPHTILAGGIQQTLLRRLAQIPPAMQSLLQRAAIAGRQLDLQVIDRWAGDKLEAWLNACTNASVLAIYDGNWHFAHDKLRHAILSQISPKVRPTLHRQVAETIEAVYPSKEARTAQAEILLEHWQQAGEMGKEVEYGLLVGEQLARRAAYPRAVKILQQSLTIATHLPEIEQTVASQVMRLWRWLGRSLEQQALYEQARDAYQQSLAHAQALNDVAGQSDALRGLGLVCWRQEKLAEAAAWLQQALTLAQTLQDQHRIANLLGPLGSVLFEEGERVTGHRYTEEALTLFRAINVQSGIALMLNNLADNYDQMGEHTLATQYLEESLALALAINNRQNAVLCLLNLSSNALRCGDFARCERYANQTLSLAYETNTRDNIPFALHNLGCTALVRGDFSTAQGYFLQACERWRELQIVGDSIASLQALSWIAAQQGEQEQALAYSEQALAMAQSANNQSTITQALITRAYTLFRQQERSQALADSHAALAIACRRDDRALLVAALLSVMQAKLQIGQYEEATLLAGLLEREPTLVPLLRIMYFNSLLQELQAHLPADTFSHLYERGKQSDLQAFANTILQQSN